MFARIELVDMTTNSSALGLVVSYTEDTAIVCVNEDFYYSCPTGYIEPRRDGMLETTVFTLLSVYWVVKADGQFLCESGELSPAIFGAKLFTRKKNAIEAAAKLSFVNELKIERK
jgi:hypothetical protein